MLHRELFAKQRNIHGIIVNYQWVNGEPAMCLLRKRDSGKGGSAWVICLSSAFKYADMQYLMTASVLAAEQLGMHNDRAASFRIADIIIEGLPDLVEMKPEPGEVEALRLGAPAKFEFDDRNRKLIIH